MHEDHRQFKDIDDYEDYLDNTASWSKEQQDNDRRENLRVRRIEERGTEADGN